MTGIEWTDETWNPVRGCSRVSAGCDNCYAMHTARRFDNQYGTYKGLTRIGSRGVDWSGVVRLVPEKLDEPLRWRRPRRVFVNSMSDLFHESLSDEDIDRVFAAMTCAQRHTFQILTKRPKRMLDYLSRDHGPVNVLARILNAARAMPKPRGWIAPESHGWPYRNVWLGVSCENQKAADERIPLLLQTPAAVRFVSAEPLLEPIDFDQSVCRKSNGTNDLDWIIVGGESGPGARPCDILWVGSIVAQCRDAGVPCFVKQLGQNTIGVNLADRKGGEPTEWPLSLRVRQFPAARA